MIVASYKLERIPAAKSTNIKIIEADLKNVLVDWLDGWDHGKASDKITDTAQIGKGLAETIPKTDNNSLQVEWKVTL